MLTILALLLAAAGPTAISTHGEWKISAGGERGSCALRTIVVKDGVTREARIVQFPDGKVELAFRRSDWNERPRNLTMADIYFDRPAATTGADDSTFYFSRLDADGASVWATDTDDAFVDRMAAAKTITVRKLGEGGESYDTTRLAGKLEGLRACPG